MQNEGKNDVFRGHLEECLEHLGKSLAKHASKGSRAMTKVKKPIADFCGIGIPTVNRWLRGTGLPHGETLIKLMCYLDLAGYKVIEWLKMPHGQRGFMELVGFKLITMTQAVELLGYGQASRIYEVLGGVGSPNEEKKKKMWDELKKRKEGLEQKKTELRTRLAFEPTETIPVERSSVPNANRNNVVDIAKELIRLSARITTLSAQLIEEGVK